MLAWIGASVSGAWLLRRDWQIPWIVLCALLFMALYSPWSMLVLAIMTLVSGLSVIHFRGRHDVLIAALIYSILSFFTYRVMVGAGLEVVDVAFLGLAFYMLRVIHILLESYKGNLPPVHWSELIAWLWFLPTMQVGPIHRFPAFQRDMGRRRWDPTLFEAGMKRVLFGYAKLVILGMYLVDDKMMPWLSSLPSDSWLHHYLSLVRYGASLYFKFSGYSDIAIGFALLLGFRVMENFNFPFLARDISDFWRRWHISLSSWCREYVYMPAISISRSPVIAAVASMVVLGVWHELTWRYLLWGAWHGIGIACCHFWQRSSMRNVLVNSPLAVLWSFFSWFLTMHFVLASFTLTSVDTLTETVEYLKVLTGMSW